MTGAASGLTESWPLLAAAALAYLAGSIPFGLVLTRLAGLGDIRKVGSGSIGATNVLRTGSKWLALATLVLDVGKGAVAVLVAKQFGPDLALVAAAFAILGHCYPVWLKFRGGKGVATALGILLALDPRLAVAPCLVWLLMAVLFRYSSLAALTASVTAPVAAWWLAGPKTAALAGLLSLIVVLRHRENINRLLRGEESRISFPKGK